MRARIALRVLALLLGLLALPMSLANATHVPQVADIVGSATGTWGMQCQGSAAQVDCSAVDIDLTWSTSATIQPGFGNLTSLSTVSNVSFAPLGQNGTYFEQFMTGLHTLACGPTRTSGAQVAAFVSGVGTLIATGSLAPLTVPGECNLTGGMNVRQQPTGAPYYEYWVNSVVIQPTPPATPTPAPTPTPRPSVAATPTPKPTPSFTPTTSPTETPSPSPTESGSPSGEPSQTPEQTVAGITFEPQPSAPVGAPAPPDQGGAAGWASSVHSVSDVSTDPAALGASALLAVLLLLLMGFVGELFNNTVKANYNEIAGWWTNSRLGRLASAWSRLWKAGP